MHVASARSTLATLTLASLCLALGCTVLLGCAEDPLERVRELHAQGEYLESLEVLEEFLDERPDDPEGHYLYGLACLRTGRASLGLWSLRKAREFEGWELPAGLELARAALRSGDYPASIEAASRVLELDPDEHAALQILAEAHVGKGDHEAGLRDLDRLDELGLMDGNLELLRLRALISLHRIDEAEQLFAELEEARASGSLKLPAERYCAARGTFAAERGASDEAREIFEGCLEAYPADLLLLTSALEFFDAQQDSERGTEILERSLEKEPAAIQVRELLAHRLRSMGRAEDAERVLLEGTELEPARLAAPSWAALGIHYFAVEDFAAAAEAWSHLVEIVPEPGSEALLAYAEALALTGQYERALEIGAKLPDAQRGVLRGRVLLEQRKPAEALEAFDEAIRLWPDNAVARYYAARAAERSGEFDRAISEYRASLRSDPGATNAGLRLARLHMAEGQYAPAVVALDLHLGRHPEDPEALTLAYRLSLRQGSRGRSAANQMLRRLARVPGEQGRALCERAESLGNREGAAAAADVLLRETRSLDLTRPELHAALRCLIEELGSAGRAEEAVAQAESARDRAPEVAALHELHALALEQSGAAREAVLADHRRALELDPEHTASWLALARLEGGAGEPDAALGHYERALASVPVESPEALEIGVELAQQLHSLGRDAEARRLLEDLLWAHPYDARVARRMAELEDGSERGRELARRAERFASQPAQRS